MDYRKVKGIVVDAGHGGDDPGASGNGIIEKDYTLKASRYMYDRFKQLGLPVTLTRDSDETLSKKERVMKNVIELKIWLMIIWAYHSVLLLLSSGQIERWWAYVINRKLLNSFEYSL